jgi:hypothetical protein
MAKEGRSERPSSLRIEDTPGTKAKADSGQTGEGGLRYWINERGETCLGDRCFTFAIDTKAGEVTVRVDRNECGADMQPIVDALFHVIGRGGRTLYESTSLIKKETEG